MVGAVILVLGCVPRQRFIVPEPSAPIYSLDVRLRPSDRSIEIGGTLAVPATTAPRDSFVFSLGERFNDLRVELLEPSTSAGPASVERVPLAARERVPGESRSARWIIRPSHPVPSGQRVRFRFSSSGVGEVAFLYYVGPEVAFASGWGDEFYPMLKDVGGLGTGEITVHAPPGWKVITGADQLSSETEASQGTFRFSQKLPTYFTFVAGPYSVVRQAAAGGDEVVAWLLSPRPHIDAYLKGASRMVRVLSTEFGPYPFGTMTLVEVPRALAQAAGFNAFSPLRFVVLNHRAFDAVDAKVQYEWLGHEMSHQWFPHAVTFDPPGFPYLEEALAEYGGIRVVDNLGGTDAVRRLRTIGYEFDPIYSAAAYFRLVGAGVDEPLATMGTGINERNLAYNKGALVFDMLAREIGYARFREIIRRLTAGQPLKKITWTQFLTAINAGAGRDVSWFFDQWLTRTGAPDFELAWQQEGTGVRGTITQAAPHYRVRLKLEARGPAGERMAQVVEVRDASTTFEMKPGFTVERIDLDPDYEVLRWTPEFRALADSVRRRPRRD
jgi:hypothetical protein